MSMLVQQNGSIVGSHYEIQNRGRAMFLASQYGWSNKKQSDTKINVGLDKQQVIWG
jgi:hypothetical protein